MITNARQYTITRAAAERFAEALADLEQQGDASAEGELERSGLVAQLDDLRAEMAEYEALRDGRVHDISVRSLLDLPEALICARVAAGLTQKQLAECLGVREQQVQQDEASLYAGAGLERLHTVATVLGMSIEGTAHLPERGALPSIPSVEELLGEGVATHTPSSSSVLSAAGMKRGWPNLSTP